MTIRPTIRLRLTLLYGVLFLVTSGVLIGVAYLFVANDVGHERSPTVRREHVEEIFANAGIPGPNTGTSGRPEPSPALEEALNQFAEDARQALLNDLLTQSLLALTITASASLALAWWVAGRALKPVDAITEAASKLSEANLHERLPNEGPDDELQRLRSSFNEMLGRLEKGFEIRRRFAADASHELRTPLAVLQAQADNVLADPEVAPSARELAIDVQIQVKRAEHLVEALLALARAEDDSSEHTELDLAELVGDVVGELVAEADAQKLELHLELEDADIVGDLALVRLLASNIIRNAIVHNNENGWLKVSVSRSEEVCELRVENSGLLLDEEQLSDLFQRFKQGNGTGKQRGHGLGLAIVEAVARAHDAEVVANPRSDGGLDLKIRFAGCVISHKA